MTWHGFLNILNSVISTGEYEWQMNDKLLEEVNLWAEKYDVLKPGTVVVVGVSGGADSVCLLDILHKLSSIKAFSVVAVHVNHMLRGEESDGDECFVRSLCENYGIPLEVFREDVAAFADDSNCSIEEAGRLIRYKDMKKVMEEYGAAHIAVAHHRDDQAETVFLNLLRGAGLDGLCGMSDIKDRIIRPLLNVSKSEIEAYIKRNRLSYRTDSSNYENTYLRNVIRNVIFPEIKLQTGTDISMSLLRMQTLLNADRDFLNQYAEEKFKDLLVSEDRSRVVLKRSGITGLHPAIAGRIIRIAWERVTGSLQGLESVHVDMVLHVVKTGGNKLSELPKGIRVIAEYDNVEIISGIAREKEETFSLKLSVPSTIELPVYKMKIETRLFTRNEYIKAFGEIVKSKENSLTQLFDYGRIKEGIYIRNRMPGDVFFPYNSNGKKKLKDFFIDQKIPTYIRGSIPLMADGKNIIWVIGFRTAENYKVSDSTESILYVNITKERN